MKKHIIIQKFIFKFKKEFLMPTNKLSYLISFLIQLKRIIIELTKKHNSQKYVLVWDIRSNAITYDFAWLLFDAYHRFNSPEKGFDIILFIPKDYSYKVPEWQLYNQFVDSSEIENRIHKMIIPIANACNCINKVSIISNKTKLLQVIKRSKLMPRFYNPSYFFPSPLCYLRVHNTLKKKKTNIRNFVRFDNCRSQSIKIKYNHIKGEFITITLRDYGFSPERNSSQHDIDMAKKLSNILSCNLVLIPDNVSKINEYKLGNISICESARYELDERIFLYSNSIVNLSQPSGPAGLSTLTMHSKTIVTNYAKGSFDNNIEYVKKLYDLNFGDQPYFNFGTYLIWNKPNYDYCEKDLVLALEKLTK